MKKLTLVLLLATASSFAQVPEAPSNLKKGYEVPDFAYEHNETDGVVQISSEVLQYFNRPSGSIRVQWTPRKFWSNNDRGPNNSQEQLIFEVPGHLRLWAWRNGIHGDWYNSSNERRLWRSRWGIATAGEPVWIVVSWSDELQYSSIINGTLRIHDWQTPPQTRSVTAGTYGGPAFTGSFILRTYPQPKRFNPCTVDTVGTINETVPYDNSGAWSEGIDPRCFSGTGSITLNWQNATENEDGTPLALSDIDNISIYKVGGQLITSVPPTPPSVTVPNLVSGEHCFYGTTIDIEGTESRSSNTICKVVP